MFDCGHIVDILDPVTNIIYNLLYAPWPVTPRDLVFVLRSKFLPDGSIFVSTRSVNHPKAPSNKKYIRTDLKFAAVSFKRINNLAKYHKMYSNQRYTNNTDTIDGNDTVEISNNNDNNDSDTGNVGCLLTYTVASDPRGSIPAFVLNQANLAQVSCCSYSILILFLFYSYSILILFLFYSYSILIPFLFYSYCYSCCYSCCYSYSIVFCYAILFLYFSIPLFLFMHNMYNVRSYINRINRINYSQC